MILPFLFLISTSPMSPECSELIRKIRNSETLTEAIYHYENSPASLTVDELFAAFQEISDQSISFKRDEIEVMLKRLRETE